MGNEERIAVLENTIGHIHEALERIDKRFDSIDRKLDKLDDKIEDKYKDVSLKLDKLDSRVDTNFKWLLGIIITLFVITAFVPAIGNLTTYLKNTNASVSK